MTRRITESIWGMEGSGHLRDCIARTSPPLYEENMAWMDRLHRRAGGRH